MKVSNEVYQRLGEAFLARNCTKMRVGLRRLIRGRVFTCKSMSGKNSGVEGNVFFPWIQVHVCKHTGGSAHYSINSINFSAINFNGMEMDEKTFFAEIDSWINNLSADEVRDCVYNAFKVWQPRNDDSVDLKKRVLDFASSEGEEVSAPQLNASDGVVSQMLLSEAKYEKRLFDCLSEGVFNGNKTARLLMQAYLDAQKKEVK